MANKYCNLEENKRIKDEYPKINSGFEDVELDIVANEDSISELQTSYNDHIAGSADFHKATNVTNNSVTVEGEKVSDALDTLKELVVVTSGAIVAQIVAMKKYLPNEIYLLDQEDATQKIQTALNGKGHIILNIEGTALIDKLTIYSDTTLEVVGTLRLKDNVNDFMLENEHCDSETERNKNISITRGTFDRNTENNTFSVPDEFGHGIFVAFGFNLRNIDNLKLSSNSFM